MRGYPLCIPALYSPLRNLCARGLSITVTDVCRETFPGLSGGFIEQITEQTYYRYCKVHGGLKVNQAKRLKELEKENAWLKKLLVEPHPPTMLISASKVLSVVTDMHD